MQLSFFEMVKKGVSTIIEVVDDFARRELVRLENLINNLAEVARTGSYNDLTDKPVIPTPPELSEVAYTGEYNDLLNKPALFSGDYNDLTNKPTLFSGDYNDLTNKPTIPTVTNNYVAPFTKLRIGEKAIVYGTVGSQSIAVTSQYVANVAYFADVNISIPSGARLSALSSVSVQTINGLGLLAVDILEQEVDHIKVRLFSPKSESITLGFSVIIMGNN